MEENEFYFKNIHDFSQFDVSIVFDESLIIPKKGIM
jgi:hypothetical protein